MVAEVRRDLVAARRAAGSRSRGHRLRRERPDEGRVVQPAVARRPAAGRHAARPARPLPGPRPRRSPCPSTSSSTGGRPHDRRRARLSGDRGPQVDEAARAGAGAHRARSASSSSRCRRGCALAERLPDRAAAPSTRSTSPRTSRRSTRRRGGGSRSRSCSCSSWRWPRASAQRQERAARARALAATGELVDPWLAHAAVHADRRPAARRASGSTRDLAARAADAAAADGRGRLRQDRGGAARDAARGRERPPGGADGADRDARRAAPARRSTGCSAATCRSPCSPGSTPAARRRELLGRLASGRAVNLLVGTHALIEPAVEFRDLALDVIDEQHRFGVRQRAALDAQGARRAACRTRCT